MGDDDECLTSTSADSSWWDDDAKLDESQQIVKIDTSNAINFNEPDIHDDDTLPTINEKWMRKKKRIII